jgi:hypothetical protein
VGAPLPPIQSSPHTPVLPLALLKVCALPSFYLTIIVYVSVCHLFACHRPAAAVAPPPVPLNIPLTPNPQQQQQQPVINPVSRLPSRRPASSLLASAMAQN